jgi:HAD superfamily hydrolase (TIGR01509 family)
MENTIPTTTDEKSKPGIVLDDRTIRAIIFDMDGLMLDTEFLERASWHAAAAELGISHLMTDEGYSQAIGKNAKDAGEVFQRMFGEHLAQMQESKRACYAKVYDDYVAEHGLPIKPGLLELLDWIEAQGLAKGVASSSKYETIQQRLTAAGIIERFDMIVSGSDERVKHGKPFPDIFLLAAELLGVPADECLVFEDSPSGIRAAHAAGMLAVMIPDLASPEQIEAVKELCFRCNPYPSLEAFIPILNSLI